jgi:16S rRNA (cytosine967-C5)-methyltransferase
MLEAENEGVVTTFLAAHPLFKLVPAKDVLAEQRIDLDTGDYLQLWPHKHGTDGFFAAVLERLPNPAKEAPTEDIAAE